LQGPIEPRQYVSLAYTDRLAELGIAPSVGSRGDSYDCENGTGLLTA
jgi:putative transposase